MPDSNSIFMPSVTLQSLQHLGDGNMGGYLGIIFTALGSDYLEGTMPVDHRTKQPMGLLHGGASVVLAETLGSVAANCVLNPETHYAVGLEINANHLKSATSGVVTGRATALHIGQTTHVWEIRIINSAGKLCCVSRITMAIVSKAKAFTKDIQQFDVSAAKPTLAENN